MGLFDRFRRNKQDGSVLPDEVNEYYQSEHRERRGVAVLLGIITLVITLLVASALFFGGRYVYRKITDKDKPAAVQTTDSNKEKQGANQQANPRAGDSQEFGATPPPTPVTPPTPSPSPTPSGTGTTPSTGDESPTSNLPRTGDEGM